VISGVSMVKGRESSAPSRRHHILSDARDSPAIPQCLRTKFC
jgi:hypothetical protein